MTFRLLFISLLATAMGQSVVLTTLPPMGREIGLSDLQVALLMTSSALAYTLGNTYWSRKGKTLGYKRCLIIGLSGYTLGTLCFASMWLLGFNQLLVGTYLFLALLITRVSQSSVMSATPPSVMGIAISISANGERVKAISKVSSAHSLGQILGPTLAGLLVSAHLLTPLFTIATLTFVAVILVWIFLKLEHHSHRQVTQQSDSALHDQHYKPFAPALIAMNVGVFLALAMMQTSLAFLLIDTHHLSTTQAAQKVGLAMMVSAVSALTVQLTLVQRTHLSPQKLIRIAFPCLAIGYLVIYTHNAIHHIYLAMAFLGVGAGISFPSIAALATSSCKAEKQATYMGLITASPSMGYIIGPPISTVLYGINNRLPFLAAGLLLACLTVVAMVHLRSRHKKTS